MTYSTISITVIKLVSQGIEMYGLANWNEVAEHVGTKSRAQCVEHYNRVYTNSPCFPLPVCHIVLFAWSSSIGFNVKV